MGLTPRLTRQHQVGHLLAHQELIDQVIQQQYLPGPAVEEVEGIWVIRVIVHRLGLLAGFIFA